MTKAWAAWSGSMAENMTGDQWAELRDAAMEGIKAVAKHRSYTIEGVTYTKESLPALIDLLERAEAGVRASNDGGILLESVVIV